MIPIDWGVALKYANLVAIAESVAPSADYGAAERTKIEALSYTLLQTLYGDELATDLDNHVGEMASFGFLALSADKELVAVLRGTGTIMEWLHDFAFLMVPCPIAGAHGFSEDGFTDVYRSLRIGKPSNALSTRDSIRSYVDSGAATSVTIAGHSLGGALATLLALDVALNTSCRAPAVYTYASPRVGDHSFAGAYNAVVATSRRVSNRQDLVPKLPPLLPLPYEHVNTRFELNPPAGKINPTIPCMHSLTTYRWLMARLAGAAGGQLDARCAMAPEIAAAALSGGG
jgi:hypothetical protein